VGAAQAIQTTAQAQGGGSGGGIIYLLEGGTISGSGTLDASGSYADSSSGTDGAGGGGGGGSVIVYTNRTICNRPHYKCIRRHWRLSVLSFG